MKKRHLLKYLTFLTSTLFVSASIVLLSPRSLTGSFAEESLPEASFLRVNQWNNNVYKESENSYTTMLEFDIGFSSSSKTGTNIATSSYDLGNKMTYNGVLVKDIPNFFSCYYDAGKDGKMLWFKVPKANLEPTGTYIYSTVFIPKGTQVYDAVIKDDITLRLINDGWCPSFGSDIPFLTKRPENVSSYGMDGGYTIKDAATAGYTEGTNSVLSLDESKNGATAATFDFCERDIDVSGLKSITFKIKFEFTTDVSTTELRLTNSAGKNWVIRYDIGTAVSGTWYSFKLNSDKTIVTDIPNGSIVECGGFSLFNARLSQFNFGVRIKPSGAKMGLVIGDVIIDYAKRETATYLGVNRYNNNVYNTERHSYTTMLEFDRPFSEVSKPESNLASSSYDIGNRMTLNGIAIKNVPNFFISYYYATDVSTPMLLIRIPEDAIAPSNGYDYTTIVIPGGTLVYDLKVKDTIQLSLVDGKWTVPLKQASFMGVNKYNNNSYNASTHLYHTMLEFDVPLAESSKANVNLAIPTEDIGNKMTFNGVTIKDIPNFFASYYYATDVETSMVFLKIPEELINNNSHAKIFMPKGTTIYDVSTRNDVTLNLANGKWLVGDKWSSTPDPVDDYDYSFAVVGDPQILNDAKPELFPKIYHWIAENGASKKVAHTIGLGDITNRNLQAEWDRARASFDELEAAGLTHTQVRGNHDMIPEFDAFFRNDAYYQQGIIGYHENMTNIYRTLDVYGVKYLILTLDYGADDAALNWANGVVESYSDYNVIVVTHGYLDRNGSLLDKNGSIPPVGTGGYNNGDDIWNKFVKKHENISMVLSGHIYCENVVVTQQIGDNGNVVTQILIDPQEMDKSTPTGLVAMFYFSNGGKDLQIEYYSTVLDLYEVTSKTKKVTISMQENSMTPEEKEADDMAKEFLSTITCDGGKTAPSVDTWRTFSFKYATLSDDAKAIFANATANESGSNVEKAVARYDYIVSKYNANVVVYNEFMVGRTVIYSSTRFGIINNGSMLYINLAIIASISFVGIALYTVNKKKKAKIYK